MNSSDHQYIGSSLARREDHRLLTGNGVFVADIRLPGMLDVALVRSEVAHGRIVGIDLAKARRMSGVEMALDGAELAVDTDAELSEALAVAMVPRLVTVRVMRAACRALR